MTFKVYECVMYIQFRPCFCWFDRYRGVFRTLTGFWIRSQLYPCVLAGKKTKQTGNSVFTIFGVSFWLYLKQRTPATYFLFPADRSSRSHEIYQKTALKNLAKFTGKHLFRNRFFKSSSSLRSTLNDIIANKDRSLQK